MTTALSRIATLATLVLGFASSATARPARCTGTFAQSCVRPVYRCLDREGACTRDLSRYFSHGEIVDCWANGARAEASGFLGGEGVVRLVNSRGRVCRTGTTRDGALTGEITIEYRRGKKRHWTIHHGPGLDGVWEITCPNGREETHAAADVEASGGCGGIASCALGMCP